MHCFHVIVEFGATVVKNIRSIARANPDRYDVSSLVFRRQCRDQYLDFRLRYREVASLGMIDASAKTGGKPE